MQALAGEKRAKVLGESDRQRKLHRKREALVLVKRLHVLGESDRQRKLHNTSTTALVGKQSGGQAEEPFQGLDGQDEALKGV